MGQKRIARLMQEMGLAGVSQRKGRCITRRDHKARPALYLGERNFTAERPDQLWVADIENQGVTHWPAPDYSV